MIETEQQYREAKKWLREFRWALRRVKEFQTRTRRPIPLTKVFEDAYGSQIEELSEEIRAYHQKKRAEREPVVKLPDGVKFSPGKMQALRKMSRQSRFQMVRVWQGLCGGCGAEPLVGARLGAKCLAKQRERMRRVK